MCYMSIFLFDVGSAHGHDPNGLCLGLGLGHSLGLVLVSSWTCSGFGLDRVPVLILVLQS